MNDSAGYAGAVSMENALIPEPWWLIALFGVILLGGLALFMRKRGGKSGYVIIEEQP